MTRIFLAIALFFLVLPAHAQDNAEVEKSYFLQYVEGKLSTPNRQISISGISGALSSSATIGQITIADREGVWLRIINASIDWNRSALLLGRLDINQLSAERIEMLRKPLPDEGMPAPEATSFQLPELPVSVILKRLDVPTISFTQDVFGVGSELKVEGRLQLADGSLDTALAITRLDEAGGDLRLDAQYANETRVLNIDLLLTEPENGIVANLLNVDGRPPMTLALKGAGPLDTLDLALSLDAAKKRLVTGSTKLRRQDNGLGFSANLSGSIASLVPGEFRAFFGEKTELTAAGVMKDGGGLSLDMLKLTGNQLTLSGSAETGTDGFLQRLKLAATIADPAAKMVVLPIPGAAATVDHAAFAIDFGNDPTGKWNGSVTIDGLTTDTFSADSTRLALAGLAENLDQTATRRITFVTTGKASGITTKRMDVAEALGKEINLGIEGAWSAGAPITLSKALLSGNGLTLSLAGQITDYVFDGNIDIDAASISPFSGIAGREVSGSMELVTKGTLNPMSGGFDLVLNGQATELTIDNSSADNLLRGVTRISGRVARNENGLIADKLRVINDQVTLMADGRFSTGAADFNFDLALADISLISKNANGRLSASGTAVGNNGHISVSVGAKIADGQLTGKKLTDATLNFAGTVLNDELTGELSGGGALDGTPVTFSTKMAVADGERRLREIEFLAGATRVAGDLVQTKEGRYAGKLSLSSTDVSTAAALFLIKARGAAQADITLSVAGDRQNATATAHINGLTGDTFRIGKADLNADIENLFGVPAVDGQVEAGDLSIGGIDVAIVKANATHAGTVTDFSVDSTLDNGTRAGVAGALAPENGGYRLSLTKVDLNQRQLSVSLVEPASVLVEGQNFAIDNLILDAGGGRIEAKGKIAETLDLSVAIKSVPLAIANAVLPDLALGGTIDGTAAISGNRTKPNVTFAIQGREVSAAALRQAGLVSITLDAKGNSSEDHLTLNASVASPEGLRALAKGTIPFRDGQLALNFDLSAFPLAALNTIIDEQNLGGTLAGSARITGSLVAPIAEFDLNGANISAEPLVDAGISSLNVKASGRYADKTITLTSANASSPEGLALTANGRIPLSGAGISVAIAGKAPLSLANNILADRGTQASGTVVLKAQISGVLQKPKVQGNFSTAGAQLVDPETNVRLNNITINGSIDGDTVSLRSASAAIGGGGRINAAGTISTNASTNFPTNIRVVLDNVRYADGNMVVATLSGNLALTGPLLRDPVLSGSIDIARAEITVPDGLASGTAYIDVKHIRAPKAVRETLKRAKANDGTPMPSGRPSVVGLDVTVRAPNRIFVRGRGLDVELGGQVRLTGPLTDIQPVGGFKLIRGRLSIVGQRIDFDEGQVSLVGDLDPFINFIARSEGSDITVFITVTGRVSDLKVVFSSQPELPQDEVLARLIFNRSIGELSPLQIAQLAAAAAELAGGSNTSLLESLRKSTALDDLDIVTDSQGNAAVRAGRYIQENIYLGVEAGAQGNTKATINLDITKDLKAKGSLGTNDSGLGLFYEKDY